MIGFYYTIHTGSKRYTHTLETGDLKCSATTTSNGSWGRQRKQEHHLERF
jgi:hypothetical protein